MSFPTDKALVAVVAIMVAVNLVHLVGPWSLHQRLARLERAAAKHERGAQ